MDRFKIAVVGSGISGLSAAWLLSQGHDVHLLEADGRLGGHSNTVDCNTAQGKIAVDTGFIVYNSATYPNLTALLDYLDVETAKSDMGFATSFDAGRYEYSGNSPLCMVGNVGNLIDAGHWRMIRDMVRFFSTADAQARDLDDTISLGQFMIDQGYAPDFINRHLVPMASAIWSSEPSQMLEYPARAFMDFFNNHGLLKFFNRPQWRTVVGGSKNYISRILADSPMTVHTGCKVRTIERLQNKVILNMADGSDMTCDHVVIACHADQALAMISKPAASEIRLLGPFRYGRNRAVLHRDDSFMPQRRRLWSSWNYMSDSLGQSASVTYWMNALQPLDTSTNVFVTINPQREPEPEKVEQEFSYEHPIFTIETARMQKHLWELQGNRRTWFCGAYFGAGFHEDGLQSGLAVAEQLGGLLRPWKVATPSNRIHVRPTAPRTDWTHLEAAE